MSARQSAHARALAALEWALAALRDAQRDLGKPGDERLADAERLIYAVAAEHASGAER
jgi:hypothetical protein